MLTQHVHVGINDNDVDGGKHVDDDGSHVEDGGNHVDGNYMIFAADI